jgi:hypothetical protein
VLAFEFVRKGLDLRAVLARIGCADERLGVLPAGAQENARFAR